MPKGPRKIKQYYVLSRVRGQLHAQIHGDGGGTDAAFRAHHDNRLLGRLAFSGLPFSAKAREDIFQGFRRHRFVNEVLHAAAHGFEESLLVGSCGGAGDQANSGTQSSKVRTENKKRLRIPTQIEKYDVGNSFARIRQLFHRNRPLLDGADQARLLQASEELRRAVSIGARDCGGHHDSAALLIGLRSLFILL